MRWAAALQRRFAALRLTERIRRRTNFQRGILYIGARRALMGGKWTPLDYFRRGEQGVWYEPSLENGTLFQDAAGTTPVTAVEQPVGLMLDKRLGLVRGPELVENGDFSQGSLGWGLVNNWTISNGVAVRDVAAAGMLGQTTPKIVAGVTYEVTFTRSRGPQLDTVKILVKEGSLAGLDYFQTGYLNGVTRAVFTATASGCFVFYCYAQGVTVDNISVRELPGNHAFQTTATSRPILRQDANGKYYLYADGIDDFMVTNAIDFTGTDKMTVVTGLRKIGTAPSVPIELSTATNTNAGAFGVYTQDGTNSYSFTSRGRGPSPAVVSKSPAAYAPPITNVITGISKISAPLIQLRVDGSVTTTVTTSQGTGNFGNYPLYLFRRGGTSLPFNGNFYGLIIRGAETQEALLNPGQKYIAGKTGVVL